MRKSPFSGHPKMAEKAATKRAKHYPENHSLIHLPAGVLMKSWFLPHRLLRPRSSSVLWCSRISTNPPCESPRIPTFSFLRKDGCSSIVDLVNDTLFDIHSLVVTFHEREIQKPWLTIYFIKWENFLKSLVKIKTHAKISINDLLTYSNYEKYDIV